MTIPYFHVDAFTDQPFKGNRAGVCLPEQSLDSVLMQQIADETNLAETAFVRKQGQGFRLQWFTPEVELSLCGHGTLAAAHILWEQGLLNPEEEAVFDTLSGRLTVRHLSDDWLELNFPAFSGSPVQLPPELTSLFPDTLRVLQTNDRYLIELDGEERVRGFIPDFEKLRRHEVMITSRADSGSSVDFVSRTFAGPVGVPEDPVTGSAHCSLGPYWAEKLGKKELLAYQSSRRGGMLKLRLEKDRVFIAGKAITLIKGQLEL
jgi:predicted PhzF superfamily epimerase YddE/YHI9